jgi:Calx-beta domain
MKYILGLVLLASGLAHGATVTGGDLHFAQASYTVQQSAKAVTIVVDRTGTSGAVSVHYATAFGTALDGINYMNKYGVLTWAAGDSSSKSFTVQLGTAAFAGFREFSVNLSSASNATLTTPSRSTVTIASSTSKLPDGAVALGYYNQLFYDQPTLSEVSTSMTDTTAKWYSGATTVGLLSMQGSELAIPLGGGVISQAHRGKQGALPFLSGAQGFYVEFAMRLSTNNGDHFEGLFLETAEHTMGLDHLSTDPAGFERWTEIDVSESGYDDGSLASVLQWSGTSPNFIPKIKNSWGTDAPLDFTKEHIYGISYDPINNVLQWYIDNVPTWRFIPTGSVIKDFHYFLVMESSSHRLHTPYDMYIRYVAAYTK